jgi:hypothetical protein
MLSIKKDFCVFYDEKSLQADIMRRMNIRVHSCDLTDEHGGKCHGEPKSLLLESF